MDRILKMSVAKKTMDNITVVFVAFEGFNQRGFQSGMPNIGQVSSTGSSADLEVVEKKETSGKIQPVFSKSQNADVLFVVDQEDMKEEQFPEKCVSDYNYINDGRCPTPPYLKPKPKRFKFDCPTIITTNPDELPGISQTFPDHIYDFLKDMPEKPPHPIISIQDDEEEAKVPTDSHATPKEMDEEENEPIHPQTHHSERISD